MGVSDWHALGLGSIRAPALVYEKTAFQALKDAGIGCWIILSAAVPADWPNSAARKFAGFQIYFPSGFTRICPFVCWVVFDVVLRTSSRRSSQQARPCG